MAQAAMLSGDAPSGGASTPRVLVALESYLSDMRQAMLKQARRRQAAAEGGE